MVLLFLQPVMASDTTIVLINDRLYKCIRILIGNAPFLAVLVGPRIISFVRKILMLRKPTGDPGHGMPVIR